MDIEKAQADMRFGYFGGAPGVAISGIVWLAAAAVVYLGELRLSIMTLFFGGMVIHPLAILVARLLGRPGSHSRDNPLRWLALEGTVILLLGVALALGFSQFHADHFFPVMLVVIGGRYLTFQTLYGMRLYWICGATLAALGAVCFVLRVPGGQAALLGGVIEVSFSVAAFALQRRRGEIAS